MSFDQQSVQNNGGVAWAKQVAESMDPGAVGGQIQAYQAAAKQIAHIQTTLQNVKNNLAATWTGEAADNAQASFQQSVNHADETHNLIAAVIKPLQNAMSAQQTLIKSMSKVPDEQSVPSTNMAEHAWDWATGQTTPTQRVESQNALARGKAAAALNEFSDSYGEAATTLSAIGQSEDSFTPGNSGGGSWNLGAVPSSSGDGTASSYSESVSSRSTSTAGYSAGSFGTVAAGTTARTSTPTGTTSSTTGIGKVSDPATVLAGTTVTGGKAGPSGGDTGVLTGTGRDSRPVVFNTGGVITDDPAEGSTYGGSSGGLGDDSVGPHYGSGSGTPGETSDGELSSGTGTGTGSSSGKTSSGDGNSLIEDSEAPSSGATTEGEPSEASMGGMGSGAGMGGGDADLSSSQYSRGRYFDDEDSDGSGALPPVRSVYEDATDVDGNKLNLLGPGRSVRSGDDEEDERGKRSSYLKEDEFWNNAQRIVPPVIQ